MNKQIYALLKKIITTPERPLRLTEISEAFGVSKRTIYNYGEELFDYLTSLGVCETLLFDGKEFRFTGTSAQRSYIIASMNSLTFYEYRLSGRERQFILLCLLICSETPVKNDTLKELLCVSRNTIINDLQAIKLKSKAYHTHFLKSTQDGLWFVGPENDKRTFLLDSLLSDWDYEECFAAQPINPCTLYITNILKIIKYRSLAEACIKQTEVMLDLEISDADFYRILFILIFQIGRIQTGHQAQDIQTSEFPLSLVRFSQAVGDTLKSKVNWISAETAFFIKTLKDMDIVLKINSTPQDSVLFAMIIKEFLQNVSFSYKMDFLSDSLLLEYLCAHISACCHRLQSGKKLENPYLLETQNRYAKDFAIIKQNIYILENGLNISLSDNETAYILMHILASMERGKLNHYVPNILITCSSGMATGNFLAMQITKYFHVQLVDICPAHKAAEMIKNKNIDLIISTVPLDSLPVPSLTVSVLLTETDLTEIRAFLNTLEGKRKISLSDQSRLSTFSLSITLNEKTMFLKLFSSERILLDKEITDWKEGIIAAGELLLWQKKITVNYLQQMIDLVIKYGPYIVIAPGIALAHASPQDGVIEPAISLLRLKQPVAFGNHQYSPVSIILACAVYDTPEYANILIRLMTLLRRPDFSVMMKSADSEAILTYFEKQIMYPSE